MSDGVGYMKRSSKQGLAARARLAPRQLAENSWGPSWPGRGTQEGAALAAATPTDDAGLEAGIRSLRSVLFETKGRLSADVQADNRLAEVDALCSALQTSPGTVHTSKG
jgi:hypothetical protein